MKKLNDLLEYNLKLYQDDDFFSFSIDSVVLANFYKFKLTDKKIIDLCTGNGVVPLILSKRTKNNIDCIEIQDKVYDLLVENIKINNLEERINSIKGDLRSGFDDKYNNYYDVIFCNPPYFKNYKDSIKNISKEKMIARHEVMLELEELFSIVKKLLKNNGTFCFVHRADRLNEISLLLKKYNLIPKRIVFVHDRPNKEASLFYMEARLNGNEQLVVDSPFFLKDKNGDFSLEYKRMIKEVL